MVRVLIKASAFITLNFLATWRCTALELRQSEEGRLREAPSRTAPQAAARQAAPRRGPLSIRRGLQTEGVGEEAYFLDLYEVVARVRDSIGGFRPNATLVNVGAAYRDADPLYGMDLAGAFPDGFSMLGYECDAASAEVLRRNSQEPQLRVREMCVTGPSLVSDMRALGVEQSFPVLKTDIDSVDGPVLDAVLRAFSPLVVFAEITWDFPPPVEFSLIEPGPGFRPNDGCFGMSIQTADHILRRNSFRMIEAAHANVMAVHESVVHLFGDRPQDPWFWFQYTKSAFFHSHWSSQALRSTTYMSPLRLLGDGLGLYEEVARTDGHDNFGKPPLAIRSLDEAMARIAQRVSEGCQVAGAKRWLLAVGDRCCAPQWGNFSGCVCDFGAVGVP